MSDVEPGGSASAAAATDHIRPPLLPNRRRVLIVGSGGYIQAAIDFAQHLHRDVDADWRLLVLLGSDTFAFRARPSTIMVEGMPPGVIASAPSLEEWGIASRLASATGLPGCYDGDVAELASLWLASLQPDTLAELQLVSCGPPSAVEQAAATANVPLLTTATTPIPFTLNRS